VKVTPKGTAATVMAATARKRRRLWLISSDIFLPLFRSKSRSSPPGGAVSEALRLLVGCGAVVNVHSETQSLDVEFLRAIQVRDGNDDGFQLEIH
jgi:hypothetical protein